MFYMEITTKKKKKGKKSTNTNYETRHALLHKNYFNDTHALCVTIVTNIIWKRYCNVIILHFWYKTLIQ